MNRDKKSHKSSARPNLRAYSSPVLTEYGTIAKLTQGSRSTMNDGMGAGGFKKAAMGGMDDDD